ncbi:putative defensin-like protein 274 [Raphanus sativus]|uniref:Defensin-like protein 274 n=1 Tax=Raphanus sativus TaxID=3726 RepID=A0A6J0KHH0_RAPSA|nr:putative defensin-like protein 274 [Raphanus sativus]
MASSRLQLVFLLLIFSLVISAKSQGNDIMDGPCRLRGTCKQDSDCDVHCHRNTDPPAMGGHCLLARPTGPVCCCLFD